MNNLNLFSLVSLFFFLSRLFFYFSIFFSSRYQREKGEKKEEEDCYVRYSNEDYKLEK